VAIYNLAMGLTVVVALNTTYYTHSIMPEVQYGLYYLGTLLKITASYQALVFSTKDGTENRHLLWPCQRYIIAMLDYSAYKHENKPDDFKF
jgi:hypothetical protein